MTVINWCGGNFELKKYIYREEISCSRGCSLIWFQSGLFISRFRISGDANGAQPVCISTRTLTSMAEKIMEEAQAKNSTATPIWKTIFKNSW